MSLADARIKIEMLERFREEKEVPKSRFLKSLDDALLECEQSLDEASIKYVFELKSLLNNYEANGIKIKYFYRQKTQILNYYVVH